jgi:hypothetical protein
MGKWIFLLMSLCIIYACEYEPKGEYNNGSKENNTPPEVLIDLQFAQDTVIFQWPAYLDFFIDVKNTTVHWADIYMGDTLVYSNLNNRSGKINFNLDGYIKNSGTHKMKLEFFTGTNTGSMANQLEAEGFLFSKEWTLIAVPYNTPEIQEIKIEDGQLILIWDTYTGERFYYYQIQKKVQNKIYDLINIRQASNNSTIDSSYLGEPSQYRVITYSDAGVNYTSKWISFNTTPNWSQPEIKFSNYVPVITYKPELYKNIKHIYFLDYIDHIIEPMDFDGENFYSDYDAGKSTQNYTTSRFGRIVDLKLKIVPKVEFEYINYDAFSTIYERTYESVKYADEFFAFGTGYIINSNIIYFNDVTRIKKYDISNQQSTLLYEFDGFVDNFTVSSNGNYVLANIPDASHNRNYRIFYDGALSDSIIRSDIFESIDYCPYFFSISNTGISIGRWQDTTYIFDCVDFKLLHKVDFPLDSESKISPDGKYFIGNYGSLHYYNINSSEEVNELTVPEKFIYGSRSFFFSETGEYLYLLNSGRFYKLNRNDLSIVFQYFVGSDHIYNIDFNSSLILCAKEYRLNLYDLNTGDKLLTVNGGQNASSIFFVSGNTIYTNYGCKLKVK